MSSPMAGSARRSVPSPASFSSFDGRRRRVKGSAMPHMTRRLAILTATGAVLAGCDTSHSHSPTDMSSADLDFVTAAFDIIEFDWQECALAATQAKSPAVRALAAQFLQEANAFDARLRAITAADDVQPPTVLRTDLRIRVAHLRLNQGLDFDRNF